MLAQDSHRFGRRAKPDRRAGTGFARPFYLAPTPFAKGPAIIPEHALLHIRAGQSESFEAAMRQARPLIAASPGFLSIDVRPAAEQPDRYLLTVACADIAAHRDGFRASDRYKNRRDLLHGLYDPMPTITYFAESVL